MIWAQIIDGFTNAPVTSPKKQLPATHKNCKGCGEDKPVEEFYSRGKGSKRASRCKPCYITYQHELQKKRGAR